MEACLPFVIEVALNHWHAGRLFVSATCACVKVIFCVYYLDMFSLSTFDEAKYLNCILSYAMVVYR